MAADWRIERAADAPLPPGELRFSVARTLRFNRDPLPAMLEAYERFGPVFTLRLMHAPVVFMLGPAANHYMTVSHAENFLWREGIDGRPHRAPGRRAADDRRRRPQARTADHAPGLPPRAHRRLGRHHARGDRAGARGLARRQELDLYFWARRLALRVATRALFGLDPDRDVGDVDLAAEFERGLVLLRARLLPAVAARPAHTVADDDGGRGAGSTGAVHRDLPAAQARRGRRGHPLACCWRPPTRTAPRSPTSRSAIR